MSIDKTSETPEDHAVENPEAAAAAVTVVDPGSSSASRASRVTCPSSSAR